MGGFLLSLKDEDRAAPVQRSVEGWGMQSWCRLEILVVLSQNEFIPCPELSPRAACRQQQLLITRSSWAGSACCGHC